uniref:Syntaxin 6/10/61 N-terminal domain-containing protein n=1 Tax=Leersia perrieri TaxID=77586 RepID=A0A0D9XIR6_9ORYZ
MATSFDRWEKDPFFPAAEEVQESADRIEGLVVLVCARMESVYRRCLQETKVGGGGGGVVEMAAAGGGWGRVAGDLRRELHTALGTAKWQLDELQRAIKSNYGVVLAGKDTRARHDDFVSAIGHRILEVENFLKQSNTTEGRGTLSWVRLDEGEREELAHFLSAGTYQKRDEVVTIPSAGDIEVGGNARRVKIGVLSDSSNDSSGSAESGLVPAKETGPGHRRTASAYADVGVWSITIPDEGNVIDEQSFDDLPKAPLVKSPSASVLTNALQSKPRLKAKKWAGADQHEIVESLPLTNSQSCQGFDGLFQRSKSSLSTCDDNGTYNKKLYGCLGAFRRLLQRSQYQLQYGRPVQLLFLAIAVILVLIYATKAFL